jgi:hypothetical protein
MSKRKHHVFAAVIAGALLALMALPAQAFFGPFSWMMPGGWGGPWGGWDYPYYGYGYPYGGYGYPYYGGYGYPYGGYGYPYALGYSPWAYPYGVAPVAPAVPASPAAKADNK